jgi:GT2 family glycosyltransferase
MHCPSVAAIVLNYRRPDDTLECLASLGRDVYPDRTSILLDFGSGESELAAILQSFPWVQVISLPENRGYAGNNNVGIRAAMERGVEWILLLNEDTVLDPHCLSRLVETGESDIRNGILGPLVCRDDQPHLIQSAGGVLSRRWESVHLARNEADRGQFPQPHEVDFVTGCAILLRRQVVERIGLLDERFFLYWEETDLCLRARRAGWRIVNVPRAKVRHKGATQDDKPSPKVVYFMTRNRLLLMSKHNASAGAWFAVWTQMLKSLLLSTLKRRGEGTTAEHRMAVLRGGLDFLRQRWGGGAWQ